MMEIAIAPSIVIFLILAVNLIGHLNEKFKTYQTIQNSKIVTNTISKVVWFYCFWNFRTYPLLACPNCLIFDNFIWVNKILAFPSGQMNVIGFMPFLLLSKLVLKWFF